MVGKWMTGSNCGYAEFAGSFLARAPPRGGVGEILIGWEMDDGKQLWRSPVCWQFLGAGAPQRGSGGDTHYLGNGFRR